MTALEVAEDAQGASSRATRITTGRVPTPPPSPAVARWLVSRPSVDLHGIGRTDRQPRGVGMKLRSFLDDDVTDVSRRT
jgi:hypothetical protein